jgi:hypothetical protein
MCKQAWLYTGGKGESSLFGFKQDMGKISLNIALLYMYYNVEYISTGA